MSVKTYRKGVDTKLSESFVSTEFDCHGKGCCSETKIDTQLIDYLQDIRNHFGKQVFVRKHSGYRCKKHNSTLKNASKNSKHVYGMAADISVDGVAPEEIAKYAERIGVLGIGLYDTFVHVDTRTEKHFWVGHSQQRRDTFGGKPATPTLTSYKVGPVSAGDAEKIKTLAAEMQVPCIEV